MRKRLTDKSIIERAEQHNGNLSAVARSFGVTRKAIYDRMAKSEAVEAAFRDAREVMLDEAESILYQKALEGSTPELIFFLKTQGKARGYTERQELTGADGGEVTIKVKYVDAND